MEQIGIVTEVKGEKAIVQIKRAGACGGSCGKCGGCETTDRMVEAINTIGAEKGQIVRIEMSDSYILMAAFLVYLVPLIMFFIGYAAGYSLFSNELMGGACGLILLVLSFVLVRIYDKKCVSGKKSKKSLITKIIN